MAAPLPALQDLPGIFDQIDPDHPEDDSNDERENSDGIDLPTEKLRVTTSTGILKKVMPAWALNDAAKCASVTGSALNVQHDFPPFVKEHTVVVQGNLIPAGIIAVDAPPGSGLR